MQRRKRIGSSNLPITNFLFQSVLPGNAEMTPIIPTGDIITKVDRLSKQPNRAVYPVADAQGGLRDPPATEAVVERGEGESEAFLVRKCELDVLDDENPEGG